MASIDLIVTKIAPELVGCPTELIKDHIIDKTIEFYRETGIYTRGLEVEVQYVDDSFANGASEIFLTEAGRGMLPSTIKKIGVNGQVVTAEYVDLANKVHDNYLSGASLYYTFTSIDSITVFPVKLGDKIFVKAVFVPQRSMTTIDDRVYEDYVTHIAAGAKSSLMSIKNVPWSNLDMVVYYKSLFKEGITDARGVVGKGRSNKPLRAKYRSFIV